MLRFVYEDITLRTKNGQIWKWDKLPVSLYVSEFVTGALLAGNFALSKFYPPTNVKTEKNYIENRQKYRQTPTEYYLTVTSPAINTNIVRNSWDVIGDLEMEVFQGEEGIQNVASTCEHVKGLYNIWLRDGYGVSLYKFKTMNFLQGIFTMLKSFNIDYREMIIACPLKYSVFQSIRKVEYYAIEGYPLPLLSIKNKIINEKNILPETYAMCDYILNPDQNLQLSPQQRQIIIKDFIVQNYRYGPMGNSLDVILNNIISLWKQNPQKGETPSFEERLVIIRTYLENQYKDPKLVDRMMGELTQLLSYIPAMDDLSITKLYIAKREPQNFGNGKGPKKTQKYLQEKFYI